MPAFREEIFGPVAPVVVVKDVDKAVRIANATEYGLVAAIQTGSMERGLEIADRLNPGIVHVNDQTLNNDAYAPFGGTRSSPATAAGSAPRAAGTNSPSGSGSPPGRKPTASRSEAASPRDSRCQETASQAGPPVCHSSRL